MDGHRTVNKLSKIIDLLNHEHARSVGKTSVRIRYDYDALNNHEEYTVLNRDIPKESADNIVMWLKENVEKEEMINGIESNCLDLENYAVSGRVL